jgi:hypothetical protein
MAEWDLVGQIGVGDHVGRLVLARGIHIPILDTDGEIHITHTDGEIHTDTVHIGDTILIITHGDIPTMDMAQAVMAMDTQLGLHTLLCVQQIVDYMIHVRVVGQLIEEARIAPYHVV